MKPVEVKFFEIRDHATFIPVMGVRLGKEYGSCPLDGQLMWRAGYGDPLVLLTNLQDQRSSHSPYEWGPARTMCVAHDNIQKSWDDLPSGSLVDVEYILGITNHPKTSELEYNDI